MKWSVLVNLKPCWNHTQWARAKKHCNLQTWLCRSLHPTSPIDTKCKERRRSLVHLWRGSKNNLIFFRNLWFVCMWGMYLRTYAWRLLLRHDSICTIITSFTMSRVLFITNVVLLKWMLLYQSGCRNIEVDVVTSNGLHVRSTTMLTSTTTVSPNFCVLI